VNAPDKIDGTLVLYDPESGEAVEQQQPSSACGGGGQSVQPSSSAVGTNVASGAIIVATDAFVFRLPQSVRGSAVQQSSRVMALEDEDEDE
jgi:hypothetical protein